MAGRPRAKKAFPAKVAVANTGTGFPITDPATGKIYYRYQDGSWLECDPIANQVGMYCHEVGESAVPQNIKDQANQ
jgi:hypothetical protein